MAKYLITGGRKLTGTINISGNKNEVLPCMAATLLTNEPVTLTNVPNISDVAVFIEILRELGATVDYVDHRLTIHTPKLTSSKLPPDLLRKLRASILLAGPVLARQGKIELSHPGGDIIGIRTLEPLWVGLTALGYKVKQNDRQYQISVDRHHKDDVSIFMEEASVTAVENLIMNAVLKPGKTIIKNAPEEPHVANLCLMLNKMGAHIEGVGSSTIKVTGVKKLTGTEWEIGTDFLELGTYAIAAAITGGKVAVKDCSVQGLEPIIYPLQKMGVKVTQKNEYVEFEAENLQAITNLKTNIWPGFPTDMMSAFIVLATQAKGVSLLHDWMYESRMFFVDKLIFMGAHITIADPHRVVIYGPSKLVAREVESPDIRAGVALVLAALTAKGTSVINRAELIERGYESVVDKLKHLGADIERID